MSCGLKDLSIYISRGLIDIDPRALWTGFLSRAGVMIPAWSTFPAECSSSACLDLPQIVMRSCFFCNWDLVFALEVLLAGGEAWAVLGLSALLTGGKELCFVHAPHKLESKDFSGTEREAEMYWGACHKARGGLLPYLDVVSISWSRICFFMSRLSAEIKLECFLSISSFNFC
jgi:hypothetical protein